MADPYASIVQPTAAADPYAAIALSARPSAASRAGTNLLSGLGVTSNEQAKNFFVHPLDTVIKSFEAQGELAKKARDAYDRGEYLEALRHGMNYLLPFVGQQSDQAGTQLEEGDIAGGTGRMLGVGLGLGAGIKMAPTGSVPEVSEAAPTAAAAESSAPSTATKVATAPLRYAARTLESAINQKLVPAKPLLRIMTPADEAEAIHLKVPGRDIGLGTTAAPAVAPTPTPVPAPQVEPAVAAPAPERAAAVSENPSAAAPVAKSTENLPVADNGESVLRHILTGQDNPNLMKIAKSRGINVTKEAQLKPGVADKSLVNKIADDFSDEELEELRNKYLENSRFRHNFGDIGSEGWKTLSMQTYFPDVKIPATVLKRTAAAANPAKAVTSAGPSVEDQMQQMLTQVKAGKKLSDLRAQ